MRFGIWLHNNLVLSGMSHKDFADMIGVSTRSVRRWIGTNIIPRKEVMKKIYTVFPYTMVFYNEERR